MEEWHHITYYEKLCVAVRAWGGGGGREWPEMTLERHIGLRSWVMEVILLRGLDVIL